MATPRYQVAVGNIQNPYEGLSRSLSGLSKTFLDEAAREDALAREDARNAILDRRYESEQAESKRRFDAGQAIRDAQEGRASSADVLRKSQSDFVRELVSQPYDVSSIQRRKALENLSGITEADLAGPEGQFILSQVPVYQEDVLAEASRDYLSRFGTPVDQNVLSPITSRYKSISALQAAEDTAANQVRKDQMDLLKLRANLLKGSGRSGASGKSRKVPKAYAQIDITEKAKGFDKDNWPFLDSEAEDATDVLRTTRDTLQNLTDERGVPLNIPAGVADVALDFALNEATEGAALDRFSSSDFQENARKAAIELMNTGAITSGPSGSFSSRFTTGQQDMVNQILSRRVTDLYSPRNIRQTRLDAAQEAIDKRLGRGVITPAAAPASSTERDILGTIGLDTAEIPLSSARPLQEALNVPAPVSAGPIDLPSSYSSTAESLPESTRGLLDLDWGGRRNPSTKKERLSKDYLDAQKDVIKATKKVRANRNVDSEVPFQRNVRDSNEENARKAIEKLSAIRRELLELN